LIGFDRLVEQCQGNQLAAGLATVEYCRKVYEKLPPFPRFANPQRYRNMIRQIKQNPEAFPSSIFHEQLNPSRASSPNGMPLPKTREQETQQMMKRLLEQSDDDSQQLTTYSGGNKQSFRPSNMPKAWGYTNSSDASGRLAASEQKLAESTQWLEMMGLSWNQTSQDTQVSPAEKLALFQKIVKTKADSQARWKI